MHRTVLGGDHLSDTPLVGIGHLTMLAESPPDWVSLARQAGFDAVGIRAAAVAPEEEEWPMAVGSPMHAETLRRMADTGIQVLEVELIKLTPETKVSDHRPLFEVGASLGARFVNVMADDPDLSRVRDNIAGLADEARPFGLRPAIEAIPYMSVRALEDVVGVTAGSGAGIIVDPLHLHRSGASPEQLSSIDPELIAYFQLCDGPLAPPSGLPRPKSLPRNQPVGTGDLQLESRAARLLPGDGEMALVEILSHRPSGIPVSVEAPNVAMYEELGALEFARRARQSVARLMAEAERAAGTSGATAGP
jgi:sugar phosphate isomerase/epimerase